MKSSVKKQDKCQVKLTVELDAEEVGAIVKDVERVFMREAQVPGFRKGKVPLQLIRKDFADGLKQETERTMFQKFHGEAVKNEKLEEIGVLGLESIEHDDKGGKFVAIVEVKPEFKLPTYKGLKVEFKDAKVEESAVTEQVDRMRKAYARYEDAKEGDVAKDGDFVQIDYEGMVGKKKILEINPDAKIVGEAKGFWTQIEEGRFLPEILDALKGMKVGESKSGVKAKFDKESAPEGLKGEKAVYTVKLVGLRNRILPNDAELVERAKSESMEKLTAEIRTSLEKQAVDQESRRREEQAIELLMKKVDFEVPETQVRRATDSYLQQFAQQAQYSGLDADYVKQNADKILKQSQEAAVRQVRLWYVIEAIAKAEKIEAEDKDIPAKVIEFVLANAKR